MEEEEEGSSRVLPCCFCAYTPSDRFTFLPFLLVVLLFNCTHFDLIRLRRLPRSCDFSFDETERETCSIPDSLTTALPPIALQEDCLYSL